MSGEIESFGFELKQTVIITIPIFNLAFFAKSNLLRMTETATRRVKTS